MIRGVGLRTNVFLFMISVTMISLVWSKFVLSMSLIGLLLMILFTQNGEDDIEIGVNKALFKSSSYQNWWPFTGFILYFLWIVASMLWSVNLESWFHDVLSKCSILGIAFIFLFIPRISSRYIFFLHRVFYVSLGISCLLILLIYIPQYEEITFMIGKGRPIPTPIDHVRFSIMLAYGSLSSLAFGGLAPIGLSKNKASRFVDIAIALFFFVFAHLLAVRSGLLLLYLGVLVILSFYILRYRKYLFGALAIILITIIPIVAFYTVPSFQNKVYYTKYDIEQSLSNKGANYSDGDRIRSIRNGIELWKVHPLLGHGAGDYKEAAEAFLSSSQQSGRSLLPHNQWIRSAMAYGIIACLLLLAAFIIAFIGNGGYRNIYLLLVLTIFFVSLMVESNLERYYALVFFMIFIGLNSLMTPDKKVKILA